MKTKNKRNYLKQNGITLIALVVTIVVLLILAGVTINALFGDTGIIKKAQDAQNKMDQAAENDLNALNGFNEWLDEQTKGTKGENEIVDISTIIGKAVDKNTKAQDAYGNKITIPKGFKILQHGTEAGSADYTYSGDNIPAVQDGIVIEDTQEGTAGNQFVWVPVGIINNKDNTTNTITLGRYSDFTMTNGEVASGQPVQVASVENCTQAVTVDDYCQELSTFREGLYENDGEKEENATARDLKTFIETTLTNGGYYMARYESGVDGTVHNSLLSTRTITDGSVKPLSQVGKGVWNNISQLDAARVSRTMYGEVKENNRLIYASDLVNSYAWDTAIIFIQTYSTGEDASTYAEENKGTAGEMQNTGINNDKYCNIGDMSGNIMEWTTESIIYIDNGSTHVRGTCRGGYSFTDPKGNKVSPSQTSGRISYSTGVTEGQVVTIGFRTILYVK